MGALWVTFCQGEACCYMGVSNNRGTPKWMVKIMENPIKHGMIWGSRIFGNTHVTVG